MNKSLLCILGIHRWRLIHVGKISWEEHPSLFDRCQKDTTVEKYGKVYECEHCSELQARIFNTNNEQKVKSL